MHTLHDYVAKQLAEKLKSRQVVVWYDERAEFEPFVRELQGDSISSKPSPVSIAGAEAQLATYAGSLFELRMNVEELVSGDTPSALVIYVPRYARDKRTSVLMELEKAGTTWEPQLNQFAKNVLLKKYTQGVVDEMLLMDRTVSYQDLARAAAEPAGGEPPSILRSIFQVEHGSSGLLAAWIADDSRDQEIVDKGATRELIQLIKAFLGLDLAEDSSIHKLRASTVRYTLVSEFRLDLECEPPAALDTIAVPTSKAEESSIRELANRLRLNYPDQYTVIADRTETEFREVRLNSVEI